MPPKRSGKGDRNKQKQEEAERLAREEEERRLREEEERRLQEEQEEKEREERERYEAEERKLLDVERQEFECIRGNITGRIQEQLDKKQEAHEWLHYISCSTLPLVSDERALNTFISIFREQTPPSTLNSALDRLKDLYELLYDASTEGSGTPSCIKLNDVVSETLDHITLSLMEDPGKNIDSETFNLIVEGEIQDRLQFCLWGNIGKNPRLKEFTFKTRDFTLDLPKPMLLADVAVRVLYLSYDLLSPLSKTYHRPATSTSIVVGSTANLIVKEEELGETVNEETNDNKSIRTTGTPKEPLSRASTAAKSTDERKQDTPSNGPVDPQLAQQDNKSGEDTGLKEEVENDKADSSDLKEVSIDLEEDEVDLRCYRPAGGVILLDLYTLPPQSKTIQDWTLKQVVVEGLKHSSHPVEASGTKTPVNISMSLPEHYYFLDSDSLQLALWDEDKLSWRSQGLQDVSFNLEERSVSFKTLRFAPLAIMSDIFVNFPYQSWEIFPIGVNHNLLHIEGGCVDITISVKKDVCSVIRPTENSILARILDKPMPIDEMMQKLSQVGYNFFPEPDVGKYASITNKTGKVESGVYECMAMCCGEWCFRWSQSNSDCGNNKVVLLSTQCSRDNWNALQQEEPDLNTFEWKEIICSDVKCHQLEMKQTDGEFSDVIKQGEQVHYDLHTLLMNKSQAIIEDTDPIHIHTIERLLKTTRLLSCT